jgi:hypothetical protein
MLWNRRYALPLLGAGFLLLIALASFLILDLTGPGPDSASSLTVVDIGQTGVGSTGQEAAEGLPSATTDAPPVVQAPASGPQGGTTDQRGGGSSTSTTVDAPHSGAPSGEGSPGMSVGASPGASGGGVSEPGTTGSTLRHIVNGGVRVERGPKSGQGSGSGSTPATTGGAR